MMEAAGRLAAAMVLVAASTACDPYKMRAWELAGEPGLLFEIQQYYERNALEEGGRCPAPLLGGVTRTEILEDTPERMVFHLSYAYRDMIRDGEDCSEMRPARCGIMLECRGFAERIFTVARSDDGLEVVDMSGPQRRRR